MPLAANSIDLVTLAQEKAFLGIGNKVDGNPNTDSDDQIQALITSFSQYVLSRTGRDSFTAVGHYIETYDGNGNSRLFLYNYPITLVNSILIGSYTLPASPDLTSYGWIIDQSKKSIAIRTGRASGAGAGVCRFSAGIGNIQVDYKAGFSAVPFDLQEAAMRAVGANFRRKDWIDLASKALTTQGGGSGTTRYRDWMLEPYVEHIICFYSRYARP